MIVRLALVWLFVAGACSSKSGSNVPADSGSSPDTKPSDGSAGADRVADARGPEVAPMCQGAALFDGCSKASDCCTGLNCLNGAFCCLGNGLDDGSSCGFDEDCCSNHCQGGPNNGTCCSGANQPCDFQFQCCGGFSCTGLGGHCCGAAQAQCATAAECCTGQTCGSICPVGRPCMQGYCCVQPGQGCSLDDDCCGGDRPAQCFNNVCCVSFGYPCTRDEECCGVSCTNGTCGG